jgi:hypothetical protein
MRARVDDDLGSWRHNGFERVRRGDSPHRYRAPPPRRVYNNYRPSPSPPLSPRQFRNERSPPRRSYYDRPIPPERVPQRSVDMDAREWRTDEPRARTNPRYHSPAYEAPEDYRAADKEEQQRWQQQRARHTPSPSERNEALSPSPRQGEQDIGLLDRINMEMANDRGHGRGRPPLSVTRGGPNSRRGTRGGVRGRSSAPVLLSRMTETTTRSTRAAPPLSLSDRMQQE